MEQPEERAIAQSDALTALFAIYRCLSQINFLEPLTLDDVDALDCARLHAEDVLEGENLMEKHQDKIDGDIAVQSDVPFEHDYVLPVNLHEFLIRADGDEVIEVRASDNHVELLCVTDDGQRHTIKDRHVTWRLNGRLQWSVTGRVAETTVKKFAEVLDLDLDDGDNAPAMTYEKAVDFLKSCPWAIEAGALDALYEEWERNNFEPDDTRQEALERRALLAGHC